MVAVRVVMGWLRLTLERVKKREKERSDMMTVGNGSLFRIHNSKMWKGRCNYLYSKVITFFTLTHRKN